MEGTTVAHYRVGRRLGRGGMGVVYEAVDDRLGRRVALKFLPSHLADSEESQRRFLQEARAASVLDHPNLCAVFDIGSTDDGDIYIAMPYCEGETLRQALARGPLPLPVALDLAIQVAEGLREAHAHGIIHRDLKPGNLMLGPDGRVRILDFGLAKLVDEQSLTISGTAVGTLAYMAPEQAAGAPVDGRTDLYALGVVLHEAFTGRLPRAGSGPAATRRATPDSLPPELETLITRCLDPDPDRRPADATEVLASLRGLQVRLGLVSGSTTAHPAPVRSHRRRRGLVVAAVAALALAAAATGFAAWWQQRDPVAASRPSLAVLPLTNLTGDPELNYLGAGLASDLITRLGALAELDVLSRVQTARIGGSGGEAAARLGVSLLLEGTLQGTAGDLVVGLHMTDVATGNVVWTHSARGSVDRLTGLQVQIARVVARATAVPLTAAERELAGYDSGSEAAFGVYLHALALDTSAGPAVQQLAVEQFERAVALAPRFVAGWVALSEAQLYQYQASGRPVLLEQAALAARRAAALAPDRADVRLAHANVLLATGHHAEAEAEIAEALATLPNPAQAYERLAWSRLDQGDAEAAAALHRSAAALAPDDWSLWYRYGLLLGRVSRYEEAIETLQRALQLAPLDAVAPRALLGAMLLSTDRVEEALTAFESIPGPVRSASLASNIGTAYFFSQRPDRLQRAREAYELAVRLSPEWATSHLNLGDVLDEAGEHAGAISAYRAALEIVRRESALNPGDIEKRARLSRIAAAAEDCPTARRTAAEVEARQPDLGRAYLFVAQAYARCGTAAETLASLRRAVDLGESPDFLAAQPEFAALHGNAEFHALTRGGGAP